MNDVIYLARACSRTLASMFTTPNRYPKRSWSSEYTRRLARGLLDAGVNETDEWLRTKQRLLSMKGPALLKVSAQPRVYQGVDCLEVSPKSGCESQRVVVYFHGGGYVVGSAESYRYTLSKLAMACSARVVGVDYRLAPEHSLDEVQSDCLQVTQKLLEQGHEVVLMGDSAGAALCIEVAKRLKADSKLDGVVGLVLISPWVAPDDPELLSKEFKDGDLLSEAILSRWSAAIRPDNSPNSAANYQDLECTGFPPTYIQAGGAELFLGQILSLVELMEQKGVEVRIDVFDQQFHVFQTLAPLVREADSAIEQLAAAVRQF